MWMLDVSKRRVLPRFQLVRPSGGQYAHLRMTWRRADPCPFTQAEHKLEGDELVPEDSMRLALGVKVRRSWSPADNSHSRRLESG
jgi:hypothetical protein